MALGTISFEQKPVEGAAKIPAITNWTPVLPYTVKQTSISALYYFKFILEIRIDDGSGELLGKIKQRHNGYATVTDVHTVFNVSEIINSQLEVTYADQNSTADSIHTLGKNVAAKIFSHNYNQLKYIYVKAYQQYSSTSNGTPVEDAAENTTNTKYYIAASLPLETARSSGTYFQGNQFQIFQTKDVNGRFLSDVQQSSGSVVASSVYRNYIQDTDYHTVAFLNSESAFDSDIDIIEINYYDSSGVQIGSAQSITNENATGGANPATAGGEADTVAEKLLYFGCGPGNLQAQSINTSARPSAFTDWAYYTIQGKDDTGTPAASTALYYFIKQDTSCKGFKVRRLGWRNSVGCWDYFNFKMKSTQSIEVKRDSYSKMLGEFNSTKYLYNNFDRGIKNRNVEARLTEVLNTDFITEQDAQLLEKLIISNDVFIVENADTDYTVPVIIRDSSFVRKTVANDKVKIQYTIQIEYANPLNTNS
tara:strand:+ start:776 stop:2209 length:1434 start_codon:yes stop_codon:yes gene_type:complete